jgi:hypothetical protein
MENYNNNNIENKPAENLNNNPINNQPEIKPITSANASAQKTQGK